MGNRLCSRLCKWRLYRIEREVSYKVDMNKMNASESKTELRSGLILVPSVGVRCQC